MSLRSDAANLHRADKATRRGAERRQAARDQAAGVRSRNQADDAAAKRANYKKYIHDAPLEKTLRSAERTAGKVVKKLNPFD